MTPSPRQPSGDACGPQAALSVGALLDRLKKADLGIAWRFWSGQESGSLPRTQKKMRTDLEAWLEEPGRVMDRVEQLGRSHQSLFDLLLGAPQFELTMGEIVAAKDLAYLSSYDLEAGLEQMRRQALVQECAARRVSVHGARSFAVCEELGNSILRERRARRRGIFDTLTLRGHLDRMYDSPERAARTPPARVREMYKLYSNEASCVARVERLPDGLQELVRKVMMEFGGVLPKAYFERMETELTHWNGKRWAKILEDSLVGTVEHLDLGRYGIAHTGETLIVFNEVTLAWLKRVAVPGDPDAPHEAASMGVDLVANVSRFLAFIIEQNVRFTVKGEIFKSTGKRIVRDLIPDPGREIEREDLLGFIYRFACAEDLIESTGMRTFALTEAGRNWDERSLDEKLATVLEYIVQESEGSRGGYHQVRLRHILISLTKRIEAGVWYDLMYLPFIARNNYLCRLDELAVEEHFSSGGGASHRAGEDLQRMAWNLVSWLRKRFHILGLVDLGYDGRGHPVAMRLTPSGARVLGIEGPGHATVGTAHLVVTPDFEIVLLPSEDDAQVVHDLDRFADRTGTGDLKQFKLSSDSIRRGLLDGMSLARMLDTLELNSRTPIPQNVIYSLRDWAAQAGLLHLDAELVVQGSDEVVFEQFLRDPGVRPYVQRRCGDKRAQLKAGPSPARMRTLLRELSFLVELI